MNTCALIILLLSAAELIFESIDMHESITMATIPQIQLSIMQWVNILLTPELAAYFHTVTGNILHNTLFLALANEVDLFVYIILI